ncbi:hypothetical protein HPB49_021844 [Dermacentor silvarum]|uniref:Uncharacterized protein n=1 Tax=Dermacentor silvarum TaxID=543639 RepID=A0ACB8D047_DERSI|nr:hypothetical protein HPB49_021844 [Dermacentor silvarum]
MRPTRLNHHNTRHFYTAKTGFRPNLSTQDSPHLLRRMASARRGNTKRPGILVAVDLKKEFDTVKNAAVTKALEPSGASTLIVKFGKSFLHSRTCENRTSKSNPRVFDNTIEESVKEPY